jgi:hypothetical protein
MGLYMSSEKSTTGPSSIFNSKTRLESKRGRGNEFGYDAPLSTSLTVR